MGHTFHPSILREYDIRGIVGEVLGEEDAALLGRVFGTLVKRNGGQKICVGMDGRVSSPALIHALIKELAATGLIVLNTGLGPTPMLYFAVHHLQADAGIQVTGSHNPSKYNGFKIMLGRGPFFGQQIQSLNTLAKAEDFETGLGSIENIDIRDDYIERVCKDYFALAGHDSPVDVAWDTSNGAAGPVLKALIKKLPGHHVILNDNVDGTFPAHVPDPTVPAAFKQLQKTVKKYKLSIGLCFDGDGDRLGAVAADGTIAWGDQILSLLAEDLLKDCPGATIIADVKSSNQLFNSVKQHGGKPIIWKTGHSLIKKKMAETGAALAGEMSGHIFFADRYYGFDDAIYSALRLLAALTRANTTLADWLAAQPKTYNTPEIRFPCPEDDKFRAVERLKKHLKAKGIAFDDIDGVRVTTEDGWWLLRASHTQAVLVARCEAVSPKTLKKVETSLQTNLKAARISFDIEGAV